MFLGDFLVLLADGKYVPIKDIKAGDMVISHAGKPRQVLETFCEKLSGKASRIDIGKKCFLIGMSSNVYIFERKGKKINARVDQTTNKDLIYGYMRPDKLFFEKEFDEFDFQQYLDIRKITSYNSCEISSETFYNISVEEEHSFLLSGHTGSFLYGCRSK